MAKEKDEGARGRGGEGGKEKPARPRVTEQVRSGAPDPKPEGGAPDAQ